MSGHRARRRNRGMSVAVLAVLFFSVLVGAGEATPSRYVAVDLGVLAPNGASRAVAVNASGQVVGEATVRPFGSHAFSWTKQTGMLDLGTLGGLGSNAVAVSDSGQVVGDSYIDPRDNEAVHAFSWTKQGGMVDLGTLGGIASHATGVSPGGVVVGWSWTAGNRAAHPFAWTQKGGMVDLGQQGYYDTGEADAVSPSGEVVGSSGGHGFSWTQRTGMVDLGSFGGAFGNFSAAVAVSPSGQIVGYASTPVTDELHAVSWSKEGMVDLGALPGTEYSYAVGVNAAGDVIGHSDHFNGQTGNVDQRAFLWTKQRGLVDLGSLGGSDTRPTVISPDGQVIGFSGTASSFAHAFSWTEQAGIVDLGTLGGGFSIAVALNARGQIVGSSELPAISGPGGSFTVDHAVLWERS